MGGAGCAAWLAGAALYLSERLAQPNVADEWAGLAALPSSHGAALYLSERLAQPNFVDEWGGAGYAAWLAGTLVLAQSQLSNS